MISNNRNGAGRTLLVLSLIPILATFFGGYSLSLGGFGFSPDRVLVIVLLPYLVLWIAARGIKSKDIVVGIFLFYAFVAAYINNGPSWAKNFFIYAGPMVYLLYVYRLNVDSKRYELIVCAFSVIFSGLSVLLFFFGKTAFPVLFEGDRFRFLFFEPNIYGAAAALMFMLFLPYASRSLFRKFVLLLLLVSVFISYSKGPMVALLLGLLVYYNRSGINLKSVVAVLAFAAVAVVVYLSGAVDATIEGFSRESASNVRLDIVYSALTAFAHNLMIGVGPLSFGATNQDLLLSLGSESEKNLWIGNLQIAYLHDFGTIGFILINYIFFVFLKSNVKQMSNPYVCARLSGFLVIYVSAQFTTTHTLGLFWVALAVAALPTITLTKKSREEVLP